jgi:phage terminase large subunit-like protein
VSGAGGDQATDYALSVATGKVIAGPHVRASCARHLKDLEEGSARGLRWDVGASERVIRYFKTVLTVEIEEDGEDGTMSSRAEAFILEPWQCFIVGSLFGWKNKRGFRRFRRAYVEAAKGSGKSPLAAGIGHYMLSACGKLRAEVYSAGARKEQANILFQDAVEMRRRSKALQASIGERGENPVWMLTHPKSASTFRPISAEKQGKSGPRPYCGLIDEIHEHPDNTIIEMLRAGTKGNQEALILEITNSGFDRKSVCWHEHQYSIAIVHGDKDNDAWFSYVCALDEEDDPFEDETCWVKANPNLGVSIRLPYIREQVDEARGMPSKEGGVRRLNFCQWTDSEKSAIPRAVWSACQGSVDPDALTKAGYPCKGGLDLSRTGDLTAFTLTWVLDPAKDKWKFASKTWFWTPKDTLAERAKHDQAPYELWVEQKHLEAVPGKFIKFPWLADALLDLCSRYHPEIIGCDEYGLKQLIEALEEKGQTIDGLVVHPQGYQQREIGERLGYVDSGAEKITLWMPDSINKLEAALLETRIIIDPNPVMTMCSQGVVYTPNRTGHRMFDKSKATTRIDGMVSLAESVGVATIPTIFNQATALEKAILERAGLA